MCCYYKHCSYILHPEDTCCATSDNTTSRRGLSQCQYHTCHLSPSAATRQETNICQVKLIQLCSVYKVVLYLYTYQTTVNVANSLQYYVLTNLPNHSHTQPHLAKPSHTQPNIATHSHNQPHLVTPSHTQPHLATSSHTLTIKCLLYFIRRCDQITTQTF